jgi:hypothetical protein
MTSDCREHIPEHPVNKKPTSLTIQHLGEQVSKDLLGRDVGHKGFAHYNGLTTLHKIILSHIGLFVVKMSLEMLFNFK